MKNKQIGLFGFGCVAQGFASSLESSGIPAAIRSICVKDGKKERQGPTSLFTTRPEDLLTDPNIDIIVELIDDDAAAKDFLFQSLKAGKPVISANKKMIAEHLRDVIAWRRQFGPPVLYEGAVAGSIPILQNLSQFFSNQTVHSIRGILNGSTNYILTRMDRENMTFEKALAQAQELGFAESNPWLDISGMDAAYKTVILAYHAFGKIVSPKNVHVTGIDMLDPLLIHHSHDQNRRIKLISSIEAAKDGLTLSVQPSLVNRDDFLYGVQDEFNAITVDASLSGVQTYVGKGAGSLPTSSAVLNDLRLLLEGFSYSQPVQKTHLKKSA